MPRKKNTVKQSKINKTTPSSAATTKRRKKRVRENDKECVEEEFPIVKKWKEGANVEESTSNEIPAIPLDLFKSVIIPLLDLKTKKNLRLASSTFQKLLDEQFLKMVGRLGRSVTKEDMLSFPTNLHTLRCEKLGFVHVQLLPENLKHLEDTEFRNLPESLEVLIVKEDDERFFTKKKRTLISDKRFGQLPTNLKHLAFHSDIPLTGSGFKELPDSLETLEVHAKLIDWKWMTEKIPNNLKKISLATFPQADDLGPLQQRGIETKKESTITKIGTLVP